MQRVELVEKAGSGLVRIDNAIKKYKLPRAIITADKQWFTITFKRPDLEKKTIQERLETSERDTIKDTIKLLSENEKRIVEEIIKNPKVTSEQLSEIIGINLRNVKNNLKKLKDKGILKRVGSRKSGYWSKLE